MFNSQGCPKWSDLPTYDNSSKKFIAGRFYFGRGASIPPLACNSNPDYRPEVPYFDIPDGFNQTLKNNSLTPFPVSSYFVQPGCTIYLFQYANYVAKIKTLERPRAKLGAENFFGNEFEYLGWYSSIISECNMTYPNCAASDRWKSVAYVDNSQSSSPTNFRYNYQLGTEWSSEISHSFSKSTSITASVTASFFSNFEAALETSSRSVYFSVFCHINCRQKERV